MSSILKERYEVMRKAKQYRTDFLTETIPLQDIQQTEKRKIVERFRSSFAGGYVYVEMRLKYLLRNPTDLDEEFLRENQPDKYEKSERTVEEASRFKEKVSISREILGEPKYGEIIYVSTFIPYKISLDTKLKKLVGLDKLLTELENFNEMALNIRPAYFVHHGRCILEANGEKIANINFITGNQRVLQFLTEEERKFGAMAKPAYEEALTADDLKMLAEYCYSVSPLIAEDCKDRPVILRRLNPFGFPESIEGRYEKKYGGRRPYSVRTGRDILSYILEEKAISFIPETHNFKGELLECVIDKDPSNKFDFGYTSWFFNDSDTFLKELGFKFYPRVTGGKGEHDIIPMVLEKEFDIILPKGVVFETYSKRRDEKDKITDSAVAATTVLAYAYKLEREKIDFKARPISLSPMDRISCLRGMLMDISPMLARHGRIARLSPNRKTGRVCAPVKKFPETESELIRITRMQHVIENLENFVEPDLTNKEKQENYRILRDVSNKYADSFTENFDKDLTERLF